MKTYLSILIKALGMSILNKITLFCICILLSNCQNNDKSRGFMKKNLPSLSFLSGTQLDTSIDNLANEWLMKQGTLSLSVRDATTGKEIYDYNSEKIVNVASCMKLVTTATALGTLGADYRFKTDLEYSGAITNGKLNGGIYIKGGGDPSLGSRLIAGQSFSKVINTWVQKIKNLGIKEINQGIIADEEIFSGKVTPEEWTWGDMGNYYGASATSINVMDNTYKLYFQPGKLRWRAKILKTAPYLPKIKFVNEVNTAESGTGDRASISGSPYEQTRYVSGTIPQGGSFFIKGSIPDPADYCAYRLTVALRKAGIKVKEEGTTTRLLKLNKKPFSKQRKLIYRHQSPTLKEIIDYTNLYSVNLYTEAMLKMMGVRQEKQGSTHAGTKAIFKYWTSRGVSKTGLMIKDGSGLSRSNGITTKQLSHILYLAKKQSYFKPFYGSIPLAGISGTMKHVKVGFKNLKAKTGGMTGVVAFTGYFKAKNGKLMSFSLVANDYTCSYRAMKDKLLKLMSVMLVEKY